MATIQTQNKRAVERKDNYFGCRFTQARARLVRRALKEGRFGPREPNTRYWGPRKGVRTTVNLFGTPPDIPNIQDSLSAKHLLPTSLEDQAATGCFEDGVLISKAAAEKMVMQTYGTRQKFAEQAHDLPPRISNEEIQKKVENGEDLTGTGFLDLRLPPKHSTLTKDIPEKILPESFYHGHRLSVNNGRHGAFAEERANATKRYNEEVARLLKSGNDILEAKKQPDDGAGNTRFTLSP